jgi:hypothetical protein
LLDFSGIFGLTARISGQKAEISIPGNEEPKILIKRIHTIFVEIEVLGSARSRV